MDALLLERLAKALHDATRDLLPGAIASYEEQTAEHKAQCRAMAEAVIKSYLEATGDVYAQRNTPCRCGKVESGGNLYCASCEQWFCDACYVAKHSKQPTSEVLVQPCAWCKEMHISNIYCRRCNKWYCSLHYEAH